MVSVVGREAELAALAELLNGLDAGPPAALALWGEAGIGKTTVWEAGVADALDRGYTVLASRPAAPEMHLSHAGLADLLRDVGLEYLDLLPRPQRRALDAALLRGGVTDPAPDPRAVAAGLSTLLNVMAAVTPVLVAVDDLQWLDDPSRRALRFAVRRCSGPVATLCAERTERSTGPQSDLSPPDPDRLRRLRIRPLSLGALHHVVAQRTGRAFPRPVMVRVAELSGGNPFFALEIARVLDVGGSDPAAFPNTLAEVVPDHIGSLPSAVREALLVASAVADPTLALVSRACGGADVATLLAPAEDSGVVELSRGRVRFTHPLLANAVYTRASPTRRRALHRLLSGVVDDVEEQARHLALAATGPDIDTVSALDAAAEHARRRGAASTAAEHLELAIGLGAAEPARQIRAARHHLHADNPSRARELLEAAIAELGPGRQRAEALGLLGSIVYATDDARHSADVLQQALQEAGEDAHLRSSIAFELGLVLANTGQMAASLPYAIIAVEAAEQTGDRGLLAEALAGLVVARLFNGEGVDEARLAQALALEDPERPSPALHWPALNAALVYLWSHRLDRARAGLAAVHERCIERGAESDLWLVLGFEVTAALWSGDIESAERLVAEMTDRGEMTGSQLTKAFVLTEKATVEAWVGRVGDARANVKGALAAMSTAGSEGPALYALAALGMAELSIGDHAATAECLGPAAAQMAAMGLREPALVPFLPDAAEAFIALGRLDDARPLVEILEASGDNPGRIWAQAVGARCRGLLLAAGGELDEAMVAFERALAAHGHLALPYDEARTLLAVGRVQRRRNARRAAKASLEQAVHLFERVGAAQWAANARAELHRLGTQPGPPDQLTATEERIALLAGSGMTNRGVAAKLGVSPKTVEANLSRVYRKLGIHSRAELGSWIAARRSGSEIRTT